MCFEIVKRYLSFFKTPDAILDKKLESYHMTISLYMKEKGELTMSPLP